MQDVDVSHLKPETIRFEIDDEGNFIYINIEYSIHCYTEKFNEELNSNSEVIYDRGRRKRVFNADRYKFSLVLPDKVKEMFSKKVTVTQHNNYKYVTEVVEDERKYLIFFSIKKDNSRKNSVNVMIESAYPDDRGKSVNRKRPSSIRFRVLAYKTNRNERLRFSYR